MWTLETRVQTTPMGRHVLSLPCCDPDPDTEDDFCRFCDSTDCRCSARFDLTGSGRAFDQVRRSRQPHTDKLLRTSLPNPRFCPSTCTLCGIGNIYGPPSCLDKHCPNPLPEPNTPTMADLCETDRDGYPLDYEPSEADKLRFYREDDEARNFSDGRGDC